MIAILPWPPTLLARLLCAPTLTGTSFDLAQVWTAGVRLAVSTLAPDTYGSTNWDVAVVSLRDEEGGLTMPTWTTHVLDRHERCPNHDS